MQTIYYQTRNFIRTEGNVVDFEAYRRKVTRLAERREEYLPQPALQSASAAPAARTVRRNRPSMLMDWVVSAALLVMAASATLSFLAL